MIILFIICLVWWLFIKAFGGKQEIEPSFWQWLAFLFCSLLFDGIVMTVQYFIITL